MMKSKSRKSRLKVPPATNLREDAHTAVAGAKYHLGVMEEILGCKNWRSEGNVNRLHWHLRAFFWELVAAMDTTRMAIKKDAGSPEYLQHSKVLQAGRKSDWYAEIDGYRNLAHQAFPIIQAEYRPDGSLVTMVLPPLQKGGPQYQIPNRLRDYYELMVDLMEHMMSRHPGERLI